MFGAIVGDVVGSHYEHFPTKSLDFDFFREHSCATDDSVLSIAVADWLLHGGDLRNYFHEYVRRYPDAGYGATFIHWARCRDLEPYNSWGNGSAMRVSPVAYVKHSLDDVLLLAKETASITHNHPDGILGAQATAGSIYLAHTGSSKNEIRDFVVDQIGYDVSRKLDDIRPRYVFDVSCAGSVPESISAFLESESFEHAIRLAISLGGDSDSMACIAGSIAEPFYGDIPDSICQTTRSYLDKQLLQVVDEFKSRFIDAGTRNG